MGYGLGSGGGGSQIWQEDPYRSTTYGSLGIPQGYAGYTQDYSGGTGGNTGFNIPTNIYPRSGSTSKSTSRSGLSESAMPYWKSYMNELMPMVGEYKNIMNMLKSPATFVEAYRPVQKGITESLIGNLASRGVLGGTTAENVLTRSAESVPTGYLQALQGIAGLFGQGAGMPLSALQLGQESTSTGGGTSYSENQSIPYQMMLQMLGML